MDQKQKLEILRLIKYLDFLKTDYILKSELYNEYDIEFRIRVDKIVQEKEDLSELIYDKVIYNQEKEESQKEKLKDDRIKKIYRNIVKRTHPDKIDDEKLNQKYIEATNAYESNSITDIILICERSNIPYELEQGDKIEFERETQILKSQIDILENSYPWKWFNTKDEKEKNSIIVDYLRTLIIRKNIIN
jgi:hypothetical protein